VHLMSDAFKVLIPMIRTINPSVIANNLVGIQPMASPNLIFNPCPYCNALNCDLEESIMEIHRSVYYKEMIDSKNQDYHVIVRTREEIAQAFFKDIMIAEYRYGVPERKDFFEIETEEQFKQIELHPMIFKEVVKDLKQQLDNPENISCITMDTLADHGVYIY
jgi:hypothetical protein